MKQQLFGTDGIRAQVGSWPLTQPELFKLGKAIGEWIIKRYGTTTVALAYDTRASSPYIANALSAGILTHPVHVCIIGIMPTPALAQCVAYNPTISCGIMITASHNPYHYNGIKIIAADGAKIDAHAQQEIEKNFYTHNTAQPTSYGTQSWHDSTDAYVNCLKKFFPQRFLQGKTVLLDCAHGAVYRLAPLVFEQFGASVMTYNTQPDGTNINHQCGALWPEPLASEVQKQKADAGFAFDGDGDRVISIGPDGKTKDGDDTLALLVDHPRYKNITTVVGTIMSNHGLELWLEKKGYRFVRTQVGDTHISRVLKNNKLALGSEQSGHTICSEYLPTGDGIFVALRIMQTLEDNPTMKSFEKLSQHALTLPITQKKDLTQHPFASIIKHNKQMLDGGRIVVRYSGTEPVLRIMTEHSDRQRAIAVAQELGSQLASKLEG